MGNFSRFVFVVVLATNEVYGMLEQPHVYKTHSESKKEGACQKPSYNQGHFEPWDFPKKQ
uniref:Uncharacterized protein n=1 Tax=uncultured verrucomicrobium HF0130_25O04 TaxID=723596 RepID=E7C342_9BACT|nr:hypothetical protein [uncultured verrucomicrobium HF0130_25O04]